jgi:D-proline reductase (dithiol) PrdB
MARISDLKPAHQLFLKAYPYRRVDWRPGAELRKPLAEARLALVTTAGFYLPDQAPFDRSIRAGDCSYRVIPRDIDPAALRIAQNSNAFDHGGIEADRNLALPLDPLRTLAARGLIGSIAPRHCSFMGSIAAPARLIGETAPAAARMLLDDAVDAVLLTPV